MLCFLCHKNKKKHKSDSGVDDCLFNNCNINWFFKRFLQNISFITKEYDNTGRVNSMLSVIQCDIDS